MAVLLGRFLSAFKGADPQPVELETIVIHSGLDTDEKLKKIMALARPLLAQMDLSSSYEPLSAENLPARRVRSELLHEIGAYHTKKHPRTLI